MGDDGPEEVAVVAVAVVIEVLQTVVTARVAVAMVVVAEMVEEFFETLDNAVVESAKEVGHSTKASRSIAIGRSTEE